MLFGGLMMLVFWGGLILLGVLAVRALMQGSMTQRTGPSALPENRALEILKERYARGELTKEQYEDMRRDLT